MTARLYTDFGFFTCNEEIGADATDFFNYLTGYSAKNELREASGGSHESEASSWRN